MKHFVLPYLAIALAVLVAPVAHAQVTGPDLVTNPGFETGDFTGYTVTLAAQGTGLSINSFPNNPHSGSYAAAFGATADEYDTISQTLTTTPGAFYDVSFYLKYNGSQTDASFVAQFDNTTLLSLSGTYGDGIYAQYSSLVQASGSSTTLSFAGYNQGAYYFLDDISVSQVAVPEPSTWAMLGLGAVGAGVVLRRRQRAA